MSLTNHVNQLLTERGDARQTFLKSSIELEQLGVVFAPTRPPELFVAVATFMDGTTMELYEGEEPEHTYKDLEGRLADLAHIGWVSVFEGENDNQDRHIHAVLDWQTGQFYFHNVVAPAQFDLPLTEPGSRVPVIFRRRITTFSAGSGAALGDMADEPAWYTAYGLGYKLLVPRDREKEAANEPYAEQRVIVVSPRGEVQWDQKA